MLRNFLANKVLLLLSANLNFRDLVLRRKINWDSDRSRCGRSTKPWCEQTRNFWSTSQLETPAFEDDRKIVKHLVKKAIFKDQTITALFEELDLNWSENELIVKSLVPENHQAV